VDGRASELRRPTVRSPANPLDECGEASRARRMEEWSNRSASGRQPNMRASRTCARTASAGAIAPIPGETVRGLVAAFILAARSAAMSAAGGRCARPRAMRAVRPRQDGGRPATDLSAVFIAAISIVDCIGGAPCATTATTHYIDTRCQKQGADQSSHAHLPAVFLPSMPHRHACASPTSSSSGLFTPPKSLSLTLPAAIYSTSLMAKSPLELVSELSGSAPGRSYSIKRPVISFWPPLTLSSQNAPNFSILNAAFVPVSPR